MWIQELTEMQMVEKLNKMNGFFCLKFVNKV
jgi:hypothetical protein